MFALSFSSELADVSGLDTYIIPKLETTKDKELVKLCVYKEMDTINNTSFSERSMLQGLKQQVKTSAAILACDHYIKLIDDIKEYDDSATAEVKKKKVEKK
jgi:hypothetical protein